MAAPWQQGSARNAEARLAALSLRSVSRHFGAVRAVDNLALDVAAGELVCLLGASGCGKSTALRLIAGFEKPDKGDILIDEVSTLLVPPNRRPTSMVFQSHALWTHMSVFGNIAFGLKLRRLPRRTIAAKVADVLALVGLSGYESRYPHRLSGGQQQRVALARSLVLEPKILLLDEPFSSLDAHLRVRLREELKSIQRRLGLTSIFVTHDQEEAMTLADRIAVMNRGAIEQIGPPREIYDRPATLFVAGFIGTMNLLPARREGDWFVAGSIEVAAPGVPPAKEWTIAFRPEDCDLTATNKPGVFTCIVEQIAELGPIRIATVVLADGARVKVQVGRRGAPEAGAEVGVCVSRLLIYRDGASPTEVVFGVRSQQVPSPLIASRAQPSQVISA
jgi:putative spermidine/putrescine transport system ATP-binding protein